MEHISGHVQDKQHLPGESSFCCARTRIKQCLQRLGFFKKSDISAMRKRLPLLRKWHPHMDHSPGSCVFPFLEPIPLNCEHAWCFLSRSSTYAGQSTEVIRVLYKLDLK